MSLSVKVESLLKRLAAKGDVYAIGILEAIKGEKAVAGGVRIEKAIANAAAFSATNCMTAKAGNLADNNLAIADGTPDFPRAVTATFVALWDGGDIVIEGIDHTGLAATETLASNAGSTRVGNVAWKEIKSVRKTAVGVTANAVSLGYNDKFGLGAKPLVAASQLCFAAGVAEAGTLDATYGTIDPATAADGSVDFVLSALKA